MRILNITHLFPNAVQPIKGLAVRAEAYELAKRGHDVFVLVPTPILARNVRGGFSIVSISRVSRFGPVRIYRFPYVELPGFLKILTVISYVIGLVAWTRKLRVFDVVHVHFLYPDAFAASLISQLDPKGCKMIATAHGSDVHQYLNRPLLRVLIGRSLHGLQRVFCVSEALRKEMIRNLPLSASKIDVVNNGVDLSLFSPREKRTSRKCFGLAEEDRIFAYVGRFTRGKGLREFIAAARVREGISWGRLLCVGTGPELKYLLKLQRFSESKVKVLGPLPHEMMPKLLSAVDVLVLPSIVEGLPGIVLESLACGTPVVGFAIEAMSEIMSEKGEESGILVKPYDYAALVRAVQSALTRSWNPNAVRSTVLRFSWSDIAKELEREYTSL